MAVAVIFKQSSLILLQPAIISVPFRGDLFTNPLLHLFYILAGSYLCILLSTWLNLSHSIFPLQIKPLKVLVVIQISVLSFGVTMRHLNACAWVVYLKNLSVMLSRWLYYLNIGRKVPETEWQLAWRFARRNMRCIVVVIQYSRSRTINVIFSQKCSCSNC